MAGPMSDPRPLTLSYSAVWADASRMLRTNSGLLTAIAGALLFLPALLMGRYLPEPEASGWSEWVRVMQEYLPTAWPWLLLSSLITMLGVVAIYLVLLATPRLTVGAALTRALPILPFYLVLTIVLNLVIGAGFLLLIIPGLLLLGKLVLASPILVVETPRAPLTAFQRSWDYSKGRMLVISGLMILIYIAASLIYYAVRVGLGSAILLISGPEDIGGLLVAIVEALIGAAFTVVATVVIAAIYRAVAPTPALARTA
jgi:hypothetical protein